MLGILLSIVVSVSIDSTNLFIGDQTPLHLQATYNAGEHVQLPIYGEELIPGIEIVERSTVDTSVLNDGRYQLSQNLLITSFKDSLFYIKPIPFVSNAETIWSSPLSLNVIQPFEIDTALAITDIKPIAKAPFWFWGIFRWVLLGLLLVGLGVGSYYAVGWWKRRENNTQASIPTELLRPAEEVALEKLDSIKQQKIWQTGQVKEYHTQLTDVVREYIARRFDVSSEEKTSDETLQAMKPLLAERKDLYNQLRKMLSVRKMDNNT